MSMRALQAVMDYSEQNGVEYTVLLMIADGVDSKTEGMHGRTVLDIAWKAHLMPWNATSNQIENGKRRCRRILTHLVSAGELVIETGGNRERKKSVYHIPILPAEPGYNPEPCSDDHDCNRSHTSLDISREEEARAVAQGNRMTRQMNETTPKRQRGANRPPHAQNDERGANRPPQGGPIDPSKGGTETPQGGPIGHPDLYPIESQSYPKVIPARENARDPSSSINQTERTEPETEAPSLPPPPLAPATAAALWRDARRALQRGMSAHGLSPSEWESWIRPVELATYEADPDSGLRTFTLSAPGSYAAELIETRYRAPVMYALAKAVHLRPDQIALSVVARTGKGA